MNILVINFLYIGDLLFCTPTLRALHEAYPDAHIDLMVDQRYQEVVQHHPLLTHVLAFEKSYYHPVWNLPALVTYVRRRRYDMVINLHESEIPTSLTAFSGARLRDGIGVKAFRPFFSRMVKERTDIHQVEAYLEILRQTGLPDPQHRGLEMFVDEASQRSADKLWQEAGLLGHRRVIGINTGGSWPTKRWTVQGYAELADLLYHEGYAPVFFGGPTDVAMVDEIVAQMKMRPALFTGKLTLLELAALARKCVAFVSGDSGPLHIATSQRVPAVAIFGPSNPVRYAPFGVPHVLVRANEPCLACRRHDCNHHRCMRAISAAQVYSALCGLLHTTTTDLVEAPRTGVAFTTN